MHYLQTEHANEIRNKGIKFKDHERKTTRLPRVLGVQSIVTKLKVVYKCHGAVFSFKVNKYT